jgi:hypothetical protein
MTLLTALTALTGMLVRGVPFRVAGTLLKHVKESAGSWDALCSPVAHALRAGLSGAERGAPFRAKMKEAVTDMGPQGFLREGARGSSEESVNLRSGKNTSAGLALESCGEDTP